MEYGDRLQHTGLNLLSNLDVSISGRRLVSGEDVVAPVFAKFIKDDIMCVNLVSLNDPFVIDDPNYDILIGAAEGVIFIGNSDRCIDLAHAMGKGKFGYVAECACVDGFPRAFWSTEDLSMYGTAFRFLKGDAPKDGGDEPIPADTDEPAPEPAPSKKPKKPAKPKTDEPKPEKKPKKPKKPAEPKPEESAPADEPAEEPKPEKPAPEPAPEPEKRLSLEEMFHVTAPAGVPDDDDVADDEEETAEQTCRRLCKEEGIEYDIGSEDDCDSDSDE